MARAVLSNPIGARETMRTKSPYTRPNIFLDLFRTASSQTLTRTAVAVAVTWVPLAVLSALRGGGSFQSFLTDYATQSRFLIIIPVLILSAPALHERRSQVAQHIETFLVPRDQYPKFHEDWTSSDKLRNSWLAQILIARVGLRNGDMAGSIPEPGGH